MQRKFKKWRMLDYAKVEIKDPKIRRELADDHAGHDFHVLRSRQRGEQLLSHLEDILSDCVALDRAVKRGPKRAHKIDRLKILINAQRALVNAIDGLDDSTWSDLYNDHLDTKRCKLPPHKAGTGIEPLVPIAVKELGRAAEELLAKLMTSKSGGAVRADEFRDQAILASASLFHAAASSDLRDPAEYRAKLTDFVRLALTVAKFKVPEPSKIRQRIPEALLKPRSAIP
jgi:hypothetical protein